MRPIFALAAPLAACLALAVTLRAQQPTAASAPQATFRGGIDLVQVDVSVLDKNRRPVHGLTAADFTIREDGLERSIAAFAAVELAPRAAASSAAWTRQVAPDVVTNDRPEAGRLVVIMFDRSIPLGPPAIAAKRIAQAAVDQLSPGDLAAVIYTGNYARNGAAQNFTADRARLKAAIEAPFLGDTVSKDAQEITGPLGLSGECYCGLCVLDAITHAADAVRDVPQRRKLLFFIGTRIVVQVPVNDDCSEPLNQARTRMFTSTALANLTIHTLDPTGLETLAPTSASSARSSSTTLPSGRARASALDTLTAALADNNERQNTLGVLGAQTGGRTVFSGATEVLPEIFLESQTYYLIGYRRTDSANDGRIHRIDVTVDRPGLEVRTRRGYVAPDAAATAPPPTDPTPAPPRNLMDALMGTLPAKELSLDLLALPFASPGRQDAAVAVILGIHQPAAGIAAGDRVDVLAAAFDPTGHPKATERRTLSVKLRPDATADLHYEVPSRFSLPPGHFEIRVAADSSASGQTGSVFAYVDVPDFAGDPLSLSGVALETTPAPYLAETDALTGVLPVTPTSRRTFDHSDRVGAFLRIYQGGAGQLAPVRLTTRVTNEGGRTLVDTAETYETARFDAARSVDVHVDVPVARLPSGQYLLSLQAESAKTIVRREVRFSVR
jgi:VWFA-related protein